MINPGTLNGLFKPHKFETKNIGDYLIKSVGEKKFWKIQFEQECSKSIDESCINTECHYNFLEFHQEELYIEIMQEIQDERKAIEKRNERDRKKYGYI